MSRPGFLRGASLPGKRSADLDPGIEHLRDGRLEPAVACFERALARAPGDARVVRGLVESRLALGLSRLHAGDALGARAEFQRALRVDPRQVGAARLLARSELRMGEPGEALRRLDRAAGYAPESFAVRLLRAACLEALGRRVQAVSALDEALAAGRRHPIPIARPSRARDDGDGARPAQDPGEPDYADHRYRRGLALASHRPLAAADQLESALALNPRFLRARVALALLSLGQGRTREAVRHFDRAEAQAPDYPDVQCWLGLARLRAGDAHAAAAALERVVESRREFARAHRHLALAYHALGRTPEALRAARRGWVVQGAAPLGLGKAWPPGFESELAEEDELTLALAIRPSAPDLWHALGRRRRARGAPAAARQALCRALEHQPRYASAALELAAAELELAEIRSAEARLAALTCWRPGWADAQALLGRSRLLLGNLQGAVAPLRAALRLNPGFEPARADLMGALLRLPRPGMPGKRVPPPGPRSWAMAPIGSAS